MIKRPEVDRARQEARAAAHQAELAQVWSGGAIVQACTAGDAQRAEAKEPEAGL